MNFERWAHIAEIVSGVAIVATIIVVIFELRTNNSLLNRQIEMDRIDRAALVFEVPELTEVLAKIKQASGPSAVHRAFMSEYDLSFLEADRAIRYTRGGMQAYQADFLFGDRERINLVLPLILEIPEVQLYWQYREPTFYPEFVEYVESFAPPDTNPGQ